MGPPPWNYNAKSCSCVDSAAKWQYNHPTAMVTTRNCPPTVSGTLDSDKQSKDCSYYTVSELATPYAAPADCCNRCDIRASKVQLIYWPPESSSVSKSINPYIFNITAEPSVQKIEASGLVSDGFTL